jgi:hypothetical protein
MTTEHDVFDQIEKDVLAARDESRELARGWRDWSREIHLAMIAKECANDLKSARELAFKKLAQRLGIETKDVAAFLTVEGATPEQIEREIETMFGENK